MITENMKTTETIATPECQVLLERTVYSDGSASGWASPYRSWSIQHLEYEQHHHLGTHVKGYGWRPRFVLYRHSKVFGEYPILRDALNAIDKHELEN